MQRPSNSNVGRCTGTKLRMRDSRIDLHQLAFAHNGRSACVLAEKREPRGNHYPGSDGIRTLSSGTGTSEIRWGSNRTSGFRARTISTGSVAAATTGAKPKTRAYRTSCACSFFERTPLRIDKAAGMRSFCAATSSGLCTSCATLALTFFSSSISESMVSLRSLASV